MASQGFHHVAIRAIDFDAALKFYAEGLGCSVRFEFSVPDRIDRAAFLDMGDGRYIEVFGQGSTVQSEGRRRSPAEEPTEGALLHFCFRVTDVEAAYSRALAAGAVSRIAPIAAQVVAGEIAFVTGPNGEVIEFLRSDKL
jgi:glyoxylase I family protein